jgi:hypothetical protein
LAEGAVKKKKKMKKLSPKPTPISANEVSLSKAFLLNPKRISLVH